MTIEKNSIVTMDLGNSSSNTFLVDTVEPEHYLLTHPLSPGVLIRVPKSKVDRSSANIKDSSERSIDYANSNKRYLDYNSSMDLEAVGIYFVMKRRLTPAQKKILADIGGVIANGKLNGDINKAMDFVTQNQSLLDDFNKMWYENFNGLFTKRIPITSKKQRSAIFNIAGYVMAELENPMALTGK